MKRQIENLALLYPIPIVLVGTWVEGRANFATVGDCAIMGLKPALVAVSLGAGCHTVRGLGEGDAFTINIPSTVLLAEVDACGIASGAHVDKSAWFSVSPGPRTGAPCIEECPVNLECRVVERVSFAHRRIFVAEVLVAHVEASLLEDDAVPRIAAMHAFDPIIYGLDNQYYRIGQPIGTGYAEGRDLVETEGAAPSSPPLDGGSEGATKGGSVS
ncbi:MAG: flavin reductase family protein [Candidatus Bipolaricaulota bacterium]|nr:MAG: flavin reductase family protein [Candidatus Bipolaricaulota bacterium]